MLVCVNGSGHRRDDVYERDMAGSFVKQLHATSPEARKFYDRGPNSLSMDVKVGWEVSLTLSQVGVLASRAASFVQTNWQLGERVVLVGYSRGGAAVIEAARRLKILRPELRIEAMFLFDAVDRDLLVNADVIPNNVSFTYHALRDPATLSRWYFSNCGTRMEPPGRLEVAKFYATHAGMGGTPWTGDHPTRPEPMPGITPGGPFGDATVWVPTITREQDEAGSRRVRAWMWERLRKHSVLGHAGRNW